MDLCINSKNNNLRERATFAAENRREHQTKRRSFGLLVRLLAVARWRRCGLICREFCIACPLRRQPHELSEKLPAEYKRSSGPGCFRSTNKRKTVSNHPWYHFLCPATIDQDGRLSESGDPDRHDAIRGPCTAAPKGPVSTQQKCKSKFASEYILKFRARLSSVLKGNPDTRVHFHSIIAGFRQK